MKLPPQKEDLGYSDTGKSSSIFSKRNQKRKLINFQYHFPKVCEKQTRRVTDIHQCSSPETGHGMAVVIFNRFSGLPRSVCWDILNVHKKAFHCWSFLTKRRIGSQGLDTGSDLKTKLQAPVVYQSACNIKFIKSTHLKYGIYITSRCWTSEKETREQAHSFLNRLFNLLRL